MHRLCYLPREPELGDVASASTLTMVCGPAHGCQGRQRLISCSKGTHTHETTGGAARSQQ